MGAFLSKPVQDKDIELGKDQFGNEYVCGSMQGWRYEQEDAHLIAPKERNLAVYCVFDGHGGPEVSKLVSRKLLLFLRDHNLCDSSEQEKIIRDVFKKMDLYIKSPEGQRDLKDILNISSSTVIEMEQDEVSLLQEEAVKPLQELVDSKHLEELNSNQSRNSEALRSDDDDPIYLDDDSDDVDEYDSPNEEDSGVSGDQVDDKNTKDVIENDDAYETKIQHSDFEKINNEESEDRKNSSDNGGSTKDENQAKYKRQASSRNPSSDSTIPQKRAKHTTEINAKSSLPHEYMFCEGDQRDDGTSQEQKICKINENPSKMFEKSETSEAETTSVDDDTDDQDESSPSGFLFETTKSGFTSGTTAIMMLLNERRAVVANIGDCRAVICQKGHAIDLSVDHKPSDDTELERIVSAGAQVTENGRINNGLNLSRAFGDWQYKMAPNISHEQQAVTYVPDITVHEIQPDDEFIIIACDGIWNTMESQEAVDFVRERLSQGKTLSDIITELLDTCMSPNLYPENGEGCDNETAIIVVLKDISGTAFEPFATPRTFFSNSRSSEAASQFVQHEPSFMQDLVVSTTEVSTTNENESEQAKGMLNKTDLETPNKPKDSFEPAALEEAASEEEEEEKEEEESIDEEDDYKTSGIFHGVGSQDAIDAIPDHQFWKTRGFSLEEYLSSIQDIVQKCNTSFKETTSL